jgi:hypothetical protein
VVTRPGGKSTTDSRLDKHTCRPCPGRRSIRERCGPAALRLGSARDGSWRSRDRPPHQLFDQGRIGARLGIGERELQPLTFLRVIEFGNRNFVYLGNRVRSIRVNANDGANI